MTYQNGLLLLGGVGLCFLGLALLILRKPVSTGYADAWSSIARPLREKLGRGERVDPLTRLWLQGIKQWHADTKNAVVGVTLSGLIALLTGLSFIVATFASGWEAYGPEERTSAAESFAAAAMRSAVQQGPTFDQSAEALLTQRRRTEVRNVNFVAMRQLPSCDARFAACGALSAVQQWSGELSWEELSRGRSIWVPQSCQTVVALTTNGSWQVLATRSCDMLSN